VTTGTQRAAARLQATLAANEVRHAGQVDASTRQQRRAHIRRTKKGGQLGVRGGLNAYTPPRDRASLRIVRVWTVGAVEYAFHATKGMRRRRA
jgi:hypothetical protein